jgi:hypothetical protein
VKNRNKQDFEVTGDLEPAVAGDDDAGEGLRIDIACRRRRNNSPQLCSRREEGGGWGSSGEVKRERKKGRRGGRRRRGKAYGRIRIISHQEGAVETTAAVSRDD